MGILGRLELTWVMCKVCKTMKLLTTMGSFGMRNLPAERTPLGDMCPFEPGWMYPQHLLKKEALIIKNAILKKLNPKATNAYVVVSIFLSIILI